MKAMEYVEREDRPDSDYDDCYVVNADDLYPDALEYAKSLLEPGASVPMYLQQHVVALREAKLPDSAWESALKDGKGLNEGQRAQRSQALESARLVFTALLREQNGGPLQLHIARGESPDRWKL